MEQKDIKRVIKAIIVVGVLLLLVIIINPQISLEQLFAKKDTVITKRSDWKNNLEWRNEADKDAYADVLWHNVTVGYLDGLKFTRTSAEKIMASPHTTEFSDWCYWSDNDCHTRLITNGVIQKEFDYLRREGGLRKEYYYLQIQNGNVSEIINSSSSLRKAFAPVDDEAEAMSFVAVTMPDLRLPDQTATIDDGYLVKAIANDTFGCGLHNPFTVIFKVAKNGTVTVIANEIKHGGVEACVD